MGKFIERPANKQSLCKRRPVFGHGVNDAKYRVTIEVNGKQLTCPYYLRWCNMLHRCYDIRLHQKHPTYKECVVCDEWLVFSVFRAWMDKQDWEDKCLDKDLLVQGNKIYSPETCLFVGQSINLMLNDRKEYRGLLPQGVSINKKSKKYNAAISIDGKCKHLGCYDTCEQAYEAYKFEKYKAIKEVALTQVEPLKSALLNYKIK